MNVFAVRPDQDIDQVEGLLGVLEFHALPSQFRIRHDELDDMANRHGLSGFVSRIRSVDAFRRATSAMERTVTIEGLHGEKYEARIEVDDVSKGDDMVVRLLNRKMIDKAKQETPLETVGKFEFHRDSGAMRVFCKEEMQAEYDYKGILFEARDLYQEFRDYHTEDTLRNAINRLVRQTRPLSIVERSQGKFIPKDSVQTMRNLQGLLQEIQERVPGQDCSVDLIPLVDSKDLRNVLSKRLTTEINAEAEEILDDLKKAKQKGRVKLEKAQVLTERFMDLRSKVEEYEKLMGTTLPELKKHIAWAVNNISDETEDELEMHGGIQPLRLT